MLADPQQFRLVFDAMLGHDPVVRMRTADAVEKITRRRPPAGGTGGGMTQAGEGAAQ